MTAKYTTRIFATTFLVCLLSDFTSSIVLSSLFGGIINNKLPLLSPIFRPVGDTAPVIFPPIFYVIAAPNVKETTTLPNGAQEVSASTVPPVVQETTTPLLELQPTMVISSETPVEVNAEAAESPAETE